jgi:ribosomal protein S19E (S16A)
MAQTAGPKITLPVRVTVGHITSRYGEITFEADSPEDVRAALSEFFRAVAAELENPTAEEVTTDGTA